MDLPDFANPFSGSPVREEDSPGNYTIELHDGKPAYFRYDMDGRKVLVRVFGGDETEEDPSEF